MTKDSELFRKVSDSIIFAKTFCEDFSGLDLLWDELKSAQEWVASVGDELSPNYSDEIFDIIFILNRIAEIAEQNELNFLAADFKRMATDIKRCLKPTPEELEGETDVSH